MESSGTIGHSRHPPIRKQVNTYLYVQTEVFQLYYHKNKIFVHFYWFIMSQVFGLHYWKHQQWLVDLPEIVTVGIVGKVSIRPSTLSHMLGVVQS